jgi:hypothetical protein
MESSLSEAQKAHIRDLPLHNLKARIEMHRKMLSLQVSDENQRLWYFSYHSQMLEFCEKVYADYILTGNDEK